VPYDALHAAVRDRPRPPVGAEGPCSAEGPRVYTEGAGVDTT